MRTARCIPIPSIVWLAFMMLILLPVTTTSASDSNDYSQERLDYAMELWTRRNMSEYSFTCWTLKGDDNVVVIGDEEEETNNTTNRRLMVRVKDGTVVQVTDLETGGNISEARATQATTVEKLFDRIQQAIMLRMQEEEQQQASSIRTTRTVVVVEYHTNYGYPTELEIIISPNATTAATNTSNLTDDHHYSIWLSDVIPVRNTPEQQALSQALATWESSQDDGLNNASDTYAFSYQRECECLPKYQGPWIIQVENDDITNIASDDTNDMAFLEYKTFLPTIAGLFDKIQDGIHLNVPVTEVAYHEKFGYPESIYIDYNANLCDEELSVQIDYFAPIGVWQKELNKAQQTWESLEMQSYTYEYKVDNMANDANDAAAAGKLIQVVEGVIVAVDGEPVQSINQSPFSDTPTIQGLFVRIQEAIMESPKKRRVVQISYDQETGYPYEIYIDYDVRGGGGGGADNDDDKWIANVTYPALDKDEKTPTNNTDPFTVQQQELLDAARARWESMGLDNYAFYLLQVQDGLALPFSGNLTVQVHHHQVARVNLEHENVTHQVFANSTVPIPNVDDLFDRIQMALSANDPLVSYTVSYRETNGIPIQVNMTTTGNETIHYYISNVWRIHALDDLDRARLVWDSYQILDYVYSYVSGSGDSWRASIQDGEVNVTSEDHHPDAVDIPDLFDSIVDIILEKWTSVVNDNVMEHLYDETYGYPKIFGPARVEFLTPYTVLREHLSDAMNVWQRLAISDYSYVVKILGWERNVEWNRPSLVRVENRTVVEVTDLETGQNASSNRTVMDARNVGSLLAQVQQAIQDRIPQIVVEYHEEYGYPTEIFMDQAVMTEEDGFHAFMSDFIPVRDTPDQDYLHAAQSLWESQGQDMYAFSYERQCNNCSVQDRGPWRVRVQKEHISWTGPNNEFYIPTIPELFGEIQRGIYLNSAEIQVTYNDKLGYPESIYIVYDTSLDEKDFAARVDNFTDTGAWESGLDQGKATWESLDMQSYSFLYKEQQPGFADSDSDGPKLLEVVDGQVVSVDGVPLKFITRKLDISYPSIPTIEDLFTRIQEAVRIGAFDVQVSYDDATGLPSDIYIDYNDQVFGDEWSAKTTLVDEPVSKAPALFKVTLAPTPTPTPPAVVDNSAGCARKLAASYAFSTAIVTAMLLDSCF
jgi:hypothetical protein